ncbi:DUF4198 domain-containing protein [Algoriphagus sediminis]|uniref:DUF4198 domain-containing protein n=1 Tax=Algoriphagus sediminis TaxID=3057113 RepID=A0ABT7YC29_9BACT|nr:DUF4198 domain-containing protein [Algoriphagus sediminis]MDN3204057.1 DUF4198 domain-containing protein [Algoriphagus sediminis]
MKKLTLCLVVLIVLSSHDMFLKLDNFFLQPNSDSVIQLLNGTFERSENVISRDRMLDVSLVGMGSRTEMDTSFWYEKDSSTYLEISTGDEGTYLVGVSTAARNIEMDAEAFNSYLEHDGVLDMLEWRKENDAMDQPAVERYSKHVKTIFQVGDELTEDWKTVLGYPIEFVPMENPYDIHPGHEMKVKLLWKGKPLSGQIVYVGNDGEAHDHSHDEPGMHTHDDGTTHSHDTGQEHSHEDETTHSHDNEDSHESDGEHSHDENHSHTHDSAEEHTHGDGTTHSHENEDQHESGEVHTHEDGTTHSHNEEETSSESHSHEGVMQLRTDSNGVISIPISSTGVWYLRTIYMELKSEEGLTHESNWATLTFAVGEGHSHEHGNDAHVHEEEGIPSYVFWGGSLILLVILFFWFNRKK